MRIKKMILTINYKGIELDCNVKVTITVDPLGTLSYCGTASPTEYDVDYDWICLPTNYLINLMPLLDNDLDKITDLVIAAYKGD